MGERQAGRLRNTARCWCLRELPSRHTFGGRGSPFNGPPTLCLRLTRFVVLLLPLLLVRVVGRGQ